ncbi:hypothetical protein LCGC14_1904920 [marine sediment metagenome]|uniref:Thymidylate synthase (FAD) n=1 Tax=marine sediment metagenome TaxID=412755 RepID=A0A0F9FVE0_9ZZZZ
MKLIKPYAQIEHPNSDYEWKRIMKAIEKAGRTCYKSEDKITNESADKFVRMLFEHDPPHESVIEHEKITVRLICDRGVSHEMVRHRLASYSQESTRYCNYNTDKHDNQITFILPCWFPDDLLGTYIDYVDFPKSSHEDKMIWINSMVNCEEDYISLINKGWKPQQARSVLPNALKTEIVVTANLREWRLIMKQRTAKAAHPQMREIMIPLLTTFAARLPVIFADIFRNLNN